MQASKKSDWLKFIAIATGLAGLGIFSTFSHPSHIKLWIAAGITAIWAAIVGLFAKIWAKVEKTLVDLVGSWLNRYIRDFATAYKRQYLNHLIQRHRVFDVKGLSTQNIYSLEIDQVYVDLSIDPTQPSQTSTNPIHAFDSSERKNIWTFLASPTLKKQNYAVIGTPGSGKTTLLKHIVLALATGKGKSHGVAYLPILLFIREQSKAIGSNFKLSLADVIKDHAVKMGIPAPPDWFKRELINGRCLIMFDGLDEIADQTLRSKVAKWVENQIETYGQNRYIISSRPFGYRSNPLSGITVLEVRPFSLAQVRQFVYRWYLANEIMSSQRNDEGVQIAAHEGADDLLNRLQRLSALVDLAVNPLLLTMITTVHRYRGSLPGRRVELYTEICDVFLGKRQQARGMELELTPAQKKRVLQPLAYHMMNSQKREIPLSEAAVQIQRSLLLVSPQMTCKDFLQLIENSSGLLLERENGIYSFAHLTFQEYLAAFHAFEERLEDTLVNHAGEAWWHETIRLYVALGDGSRIISACISKEDPTTKELSLAIECLDEARTVEPEIRQAVKAIVANNINSSDPDRRHLAIETMLTLRLRNMIRVDDEHHLDSSLISIPEYQLFLDLSQNRNRWHQPDHWEKTRVVSDDGNACLGVRFSDATAFCEWLSSKDAGDLLYEPALNGLAGDIGFPDKYWTTEGRIFNPIQSDHLNESDLKVSLKECISKDYSLLNKSPLLAGQDYPHSIDIDSGIERFQRLPVFWDSIYSQGLDLGRYLDRIFTLDADKTIDVQKAYYLEKQRNLTLARSLNHIFNPEWLLNRYDIFTRERRENRKLLRSFEQMRAFQARLANDTNLNRNLERARRLANALASNRDLSKSLEFEFIFERKFAGVWSIDPISERRIARAALRILALDSSIKLLNARNDVRKFLRGWQKQDLAKQAERLSDALFDTGLALYCLEERITGQMLPFEGIRIMRVKRLSNVQPGIRSKAASASR